MQLTKNFNLKEFACNDGSPVPSEYLDNVKRLAKNLQALRDYLGEPIDINSGYRTKKYNAKKKGKRKSQHLTASAADIVVKNKTPKQVYRAIKKLIKNGQMEDGGIGLYNGFLHYDVRGKRARWDNSSLFNFF